MDNLNHIHIFKTNISKRNLWKLSRIFETNSVQQWTIDTEDCDRVLRVVSPSHSETEIIALVSQYGFRCEELV